MKYWVLCGFLFSMQLAAQQPPLQQPKGLPQSGRGREDTGVAEGANTAGPQPIRRLSSMLHEENIEALAGRAVEFQKVTVQRVLDSQTLVLGENPDDQILVRLGWPHPEIKPGQSLYLTGQIRRKSELPTRWQSQYPGAAEARNQPIFIDATSVHVLGVVP